MILVDTSVWITHLREREPILAELLINALAVNHPYITGELACGNLKNRRRILADLATLPLAVVASDNEVLQLINDHKLWGRGFGWIDAHLIASSLLSNCRLWTLDRPLEDAAARAGVSVYRISG